MSTLAERIITAPISEFCKIAGIGRSLVYEMIGDGRLESIRIGKRRLIVIESYCQLIERQLGAAAEAETGPSDPSRKRAFYGKNRL